MVKLPFKIKIVSIDFHKTQYDGEIEFPEKKFPLVIYPIADKQTIKIPFDVIGVQNQNALVRISGINGIYAEDHLTLKVNHHPWRLVRFQYLMKFQRDIICLIRLKSFSNNYDHAKRL